MSPDSSATGSAPARGTAAGRHTAYIPALDGIRAAAVLGVMAYHSGLSFLPGGFFGVDAFFVLSGFLITTLLLGEWSGSKTVALRAFWARRARRLLPALLVLLVAVVLYARFVAAPGTYPQLRWDSLSALFYSANWWFIAAGHSYFVQTGPVSPLLHTWSLAIEEQFYIVWPVLVLLVMRLRRTEPVRALRVLLGVCVAGAVASAVEMAVLFQPGQDPTRVYFGTDTHAQCLLVGCALATVLALRRLHRPAGVLSAPSRRILTVAGVAGVGGSAWAWSQLQYGQSFVFDGGFLLVSVCVAAVITSAVLCPSGVVARVLSWSPLRFIGRISYGMYLWHFPIDVALTSARVGVQGVALFGVRSALTVAIAAASFYALERPVRHGRLVTTSAARWATPAAVLGTAVVVGLATVAPAAASVPTSAIAPAPSTATPAVSIPASLAHAPVRVLLVGDSTAQSLGLGLRHVQDRYDIAIDNQAVLGCGVALGNFVITNYATGRSRGETALPCRTEPVDGDVPWPEAWPKWIRAVKPNLVVLLAGRWEVMNRTHLGHWTDILHPVYAAYVKSMLVEAVHIATAQGAHMILETAPCYAPAELPDGSPVPEDQVGRVQAYNRLVDEVGAQFPTRVTVQNLYALTCPGGRFHPSIDGVALRSADGIHFTLATGTGAQLLAPSLLPLWEELGHSQEARGGQVVTGPLPAHLAPP